MSQPKILIAFITCNDAIYTETMRSIMELDTTGLDVQYGWFTGSITAAARNNAAERCVKQGFDWLFFADLDMTFHPQTLKRLLSHNVPIVSGMYRARRGDPGPFFAFNFREDGIPIVINSVDMTGPDLLQVGGLPTGCMLIDSSVFLRLDAHAEGRGEAGPSPGQPYFWYESRMDRIADKDRAMREVAANTGHVNEDALRFKPGFGRGEDLRFCVSCGEAAIPMYLDTRVVCGHLAVQSYGTAAIYD